MTSREWALSLWDAGFQTILAPLRGKRPIIEWKQYQTERVPRDTVEHWYSHGEHNIALIAGTISGTVVIDGDSPDACTYIESITPPTMVVATSKGAHYYFRHPGGRIANAVRMLDDPPIDLRGDGGLTIGPGSQHKSGIFYRLKTELLSVRDLPAYDRRWFPGQTRERVFLHPTLHCKAVQTDAYPQAQRYLRGVPGSIQGNGGDNHAYVVACRLIKGFALQDDQAFELMAEWNLKCNPPWSDRELLDKIRHARRYGTGDTGALLAKGNASTGFSSLGW